MVVGQEGCLDLYCTSKFCLLCGSLENVIGDGGIMVVGGGDG